MTDVSPMHRDANGTPIYGRVDSLSGSLCTMKIVQKLIQEGLIYSTSAFNSAVAVAGNLDILVVVPNDRNIHVRFAASTGGAGRVRLFENTVVSGNGVPLIVVNRNRSAGDTTTVTAFSTPTITSPGDLLYDALIPGSSGSIALGTSGATTDSFEHWVLPENLYLFRITNNAIGPEEININIDFYEEML